MTAHRTSYNNSYVFGHQSPTVTSWLPWHQCDFAIDFTENSILPPVLIWRFQGMENLPCLWANCSSAVYAGNTTFPFLYSFRGTTYPFPFVCPFKSCISYYNHCITIGGHVQLLISHGPWFLFRVVAFQDTVVYHSLCELFSLFLCLWPCIVL